MLSRAYDRLIVVLAVLASIMIAAVFVLIVVDVSMRTAGLRPPVFTSAISEYSLLYVTMMAAPYLVRHRGHVRIDSFIAHLPAPGRLLVERLLIVTCIALCLLATWYSARFAVDQQNLGAGVRQSPVLAAGAGNPLFPPLPHLVAAGPGHRIADLPELPDEGVALVAARELKEELAFLPGQEDRHFGEPHGVAPAEALGRRGGSGRGGRSHFPDRLLSARGGCRDQQAGDQDQGGDASETEPDP